VTISWRTTTTALLEDLTDPAKQAVWEQFDGRYRPILVGVARRLGLTQEDAADAAQEALLRFVRAYRAGAYDRSRGSLRAWLLAIARNCVRDIQAQRARRAERFGASQMADLPDERRMTQLWDQQQRRIMLQEALATLRASSRLGPATLRAFEMLVLERRPASNVAEELGMTLNDVYLAKHRCLKRMRSLLTRLQRSYSLDAPPQEGER
jgi:RNA polymerase sigma-70 factor (ECF subfamily)